MSTILGDWTIDWGKFSQHYQGVHSLNDLVSSTMPAMLGIPQRSVDDFSATYDETRTRRDCYLRIIPYGDGGPDLISPVLDDGDLLVFVYPRLDFATPRIDQELMLLEQRGRHAELCYKDDAGVAYEEAPWGEHLISHPCKRTLNANNEDDRIVHVFRPELPSLSPKQAIALKQQVRVWRRVFNKHRFPKDGEQFPKSPWFFDPADFATVAELEGLAKHLVCRSPNDPPQVPEVTCVQWSYEVLCLALNVPLTAENLDRLGIRGDYDKHWAGILGNPPASMTGLGRLPFVPYSPAQVLQAFLDTYANGVSLLELTKNPVADAWLRQTLKKLPAPGLADRIEGYFEEVLASGDISKPFVVPGRPPYRFVMPIVFFCEARRPPQDANTPWFRYIGTAVHQRFLLRAA